MSHAIDFLRDITLIANQINLDDFNGIVDELVHLRKRGGRLFILGVGGSAANASHAVNDFRKLCGIESYSPADNVSELTARTNDEGWNTVFSEWLKVSKISNDDAIFIFSVGGGNAKKNVSVNLINAVDLALNVGAKVLGIVGRDGGYVKEFGSHVLLIPNVNNSKVTPLAEAYQGVIWHGMVSDPRLQVTETKW